MPSPFLHLPYTPDLTESGIAYVLRALSYNYITYNRMRRMVAGVAVELAFRRCLAQENIPFEVQAALPLNERGRHDVFLNKQRCDIKSFFISYRNQISAIQRDPKILLNVPALVPSDVNALEGHLDNDLYIFAFVMGLKATTQLDIEKISAKDQPHCFIYTMPEWWRNPAHWNPLGTLILKSESDAEVEIEIHGQNQARDFISHPVKLPPRKRILVHDSFYSISSLRIKNNPTARLGIVINGQTHIIAPADWKNIYVYGIDILLAGFLTRAEFRQRAKFIPPATKVFQYNSTRVKNLAVPISMLKPVKDLFNRR